MPKRTLFTNITPLPPQVSREVAVAMLHNHDEMIELNPLVIEHHPIKTPRDAPADEFLDCVWQELTDKIHFLPGGLVKGKVSYKACFHDTPTGLQTHIYAPMGLDIREKWSICGSLPGETPEPRELGVDTPRVGLYLREDGDMKCNIMLTSFVRKNIDNSHKVLVERILMKAERVENHLKTISPSTSGTNMSTSLGPMGFQRGSHMSQSQFVTSPRSESFTHTPPTPSRSQFPDMSIHPALRNDPMNESFHRASTYTAPVYPESSSQQNGYPPDVKQNPYLQSSPPQQHPTYQGDDQPGAQRKEFLVELPGSVPDRNIQSNRDSRTYRGSISEMSAAGTAPSRLSTQQSDILPSEEGSNTSERSQVSVLPYRADQDSRRVIDFTSEQYAEQPVVAPAPPPPPPPPQKPTFQQYNQQRISR